MAIPYAFLLRYFIKITSKLDDIVKSIENRTIFLNVTAYVHKPPILIT